MPKQTVPDIQFGKFVIAEIPKLFAEQKILINTNYQRGDIWKQKQQIGLIKSISDRFSIGVLVLFINDDDQFEILDGQQRILFFQQQGLCAECKKPMDFKNTSSHHVTAHSKGGKTSELDQAQLLHDKCHKKVEKRKRKAD
jgi:5-methylcytosine-specific restriction endonuclease McrA